MSNPISGLTIGRIVIFVESGGEEFAAVVSTVVSSVSGIVHLHAFVDDEEKPVRYFRIVPMDLSESPQPHSWHWPPRV